MSRLKQRRWSRFFSKKKPKNTKSGEKMPSENEISLDEQANNNKVSPYYSSDRRVDPLQYNDNPDSLVQQKGLGVYDYMLLDDQISANSQLKKFTRLATDFHINAASGSAKDQKIADFVRWTLTDQMKIPIRVLIYNILTSIDYGFAIAEKVHEYIPDGRWKGYVGYKNIAPKSPKGFRFDIDEYGNLKKNGIVQYTDAIFNVPDNYDDMPHFPVEKFVLFSYMSKFQNPYGTSDLRAGYRSWICKDILMKLWSIYLERHAAPIPYATIGQGADDEEVEELRDIVQNLRSKSACTVPEGTELAYLESDRTASPGFESAVAIHNGSLSRSSNVPDLMGFSGGPGQGGAYGLGTVQYDIFVAYEEFLGYLIEGPVFHRQIIKPIVDLNFKNVTNYPTFKFSSIKRETRKDRAQILKILFEIGLITEYQPWMNTFADLPVPQNQMPKPGTKLVPVTNKPEAIDDNRDNRTMDPGKRTIADDTNPNVEKDK